MPTSSLSLSSLAAGQKREWARRHRLPARVQRPERAEEEAEGVEALLPPSTRCRSDRYVCRAKDKVSLLMAFRRCSCSLRHC